MERKQRFSIANNGYIDGLTKAIAEQKSLKKIFPFMVALSLVISTLAPTAVFASDSQTSITLSSVAPESYLVTDADIAVWPIWAIIILAVMGYIVHEFSILSVRDRLTRLGK